MVMWASALWKPRARWMIRRRGAGRGDYNAEMIEHIARRPRNRDRAVFVGNLDDNVDDGFGPGLPVFHDPAREHDDFAGT
jgi:hypothetical protein